MSLSPPNKSTNLAGRINRCSKGGRQPFLVLSGPPLKKGKACGSPESRGMVGLSEIEGLPCTVIGGKAAGKGFLISASGVTKVS
jgi:hypothetical protein